MVVVAAVVVVVEVVVVVMVALVNVAAVVVVVVAVVVVVVLLWPLAFPEPYLLTRRSRGAHAKLTRKLTHVLLGKSRLIGSFFREL